MSQSEGNAVTKAENTWLLRIITGMLSFTSLVVIMFLNTIINKLNDMSNFKTQTVKELAELEVWRATFDAAQRSLQGDVKDVMQYNKQYALKPEETKVKRGINNN